MQSKIFCGIEGGASVSKLILITEQAEELCYMEGPGTNHFLEGIDECHRRIFEMVQKAKEKANLDPSAVLTGLGLCMSGCEMEESNRTFETAFLSTYPQLTASCSVASDTMGPLLTASPKGGLILIAGTGSNALLVNPDGSVARCGGWGHLIGDEASAMWISQKAVKMVFDAEDNLVKPPYDISKVKQLMLQHFNAQDKFGILEHCYVNFKKSFFAGLCAKLAEAAIKDEDPLCLYLFKEAGKVLADVIAAIQPKVQKELLELEGGLPIVCVGSVFKSWDLLKPGLEENTKLDLPEFTLLTLSCSAAVGAAYLSAKKCGISLPLNFKKNVSILYRREKT